MTFSVYNRPSRFSIDFATALKVCYAANMATALNIAHIPPLAPTDNASLSARAKINPGNVKWREQYSPFGLSMTDAPANDNQAGFTGHIKDKATGLNYMQARYYDPVMGRFLSIDPVTFLDKPYPGQFNRYAYVGNDPLSYLDPNGEDKVYASIGGEFVAGLGFKADIGIYLDFSAERRFGVPVGWSSLPDIGFFTTRGIQAGAAAGVGIDFGVFKGTHNQFNGYAQSATAEAIISFNFTESNDTYGTSSWEKDFDGRSGSSSITSFGLGPQVGIHGGEVKTSTHISTTSILRSIANRFGREHSDKNGISTSGQLSGDSNNTFNNANNEDNKEIRQQNGNAGAYHIWGK